MGGGEGKVNVSLLQGVNVRVCPARDIMQA